jgi:hypothetical protein
MALMLLASSAATKVHMVFNTNHLMQRDQAEFADWWVLVSFENQVEYHCNLDFTPN